MRPILPYNTYTSKNTSPDTPELLSKYAQNVHTGAHIKWILFLTDATL